MRFGASKKIIGALLGAVCALLPTFVGAWELPTVPNCAKIEFGPAYVHMDVLESGRTVHDMDMVAGRFDGTFVFWRGITLKPVLMAAQGNGNLYTASLALGYTLPCSQTFAITPQVGMGYSYLDTKFELMGFPVKTKHTYKSYTPFIGIDLVYNLGNGWRIGGTLQYAWANTRTSLPELSLHNIKSHSEGFAYAASIEKDLSDHVSISIGAGYNNTLSKEKHGLRGYGAKVGLAYWF